MIPALTLVALLAAPGGAAPAPPQDETVRYSLAPVLTEQKLTGLAVEIRFAGDPDGETVLYLPEQWAGSGELWRYLDGVTVEGAEAVREDGPAVRRITHQPGAPLAIRYSVRSAYAGDPGFDYDHRIQRATEGRRTLRDVLLAQRTRARRQAREGQRVPAAALFVTVLREETGLDLTPDLARHIRDGQPILLPADLLGDGFEITTVTQPEFHRGFDAEATAQAGGLLTGVAVAS